MEDYFGASIRGLLLLIGILGSLCTCQQTTEKQFQCPEQFGYYSDTEDCSKYFVCVFGDALHESCTGGLHFSVELQTCDWPRNVDCPYKPSSVEKPVVSSGGGGGGGADDSFSSNRRTPSSTSSRSRPSATAGRTSSVAGRAGSRYRPEGDDDDSRHGGGRVNQIRPPSTWEPPPTTTPQSTAAATQSTVPAATPLATDPPVADPATDSPYQATTALTVYRETDPQSPEPAEDPSTSPPSKEAGLEADGEDGATGESPSNRFPGYDPQQPQFDEAVPPVVDSEGRIHIPDGIYSNGPHNAGDDISVFVKPIYADSKPSSEAGYPRTHHDEEHALPEEHKDPDPVPELGHNNGQSKDPDLVARFYRTSGDPSSDRTTAVLQLYRSNQRSQPGSYRSQPAPQPREPPTHYESQPPPQPRDPPTRYESPRVVSYGEPVSYRQQPERDHRTTYAEPPPPPEPEYSVREQSPRYTVDEEPLPVQHTNNGHPRDPDVKPPSGRQDSRYSTSRGSGRQGRVLSVDRDAYSSAREQVPKEPNPRDQRYGYETDRDFGRYPQATEAPEEPQQQRKPYSDYASLPYGYPDQFEQKQNVFVARPRTSATRSSRPRTTAAPPTTTPAPVTPAPAPPPPRTIVRRPPPAPRTASRTPAEPRGPERLPSRPAPVYSTPEPYTNALRCSPRNCKLPDCRCGGSDIPGGLPSSEVPQVVLITFDDAINDLNFELYEDLFGPRKNPNGCPILGSFYVSHEWTDYGKVQTLYSKGHEMASHSVTHSYGEKFSKNQWLKEIHGQREILNLYGGVKLEDVRGMRAPFLQIGGNKMFEMLHEANFTYDSSMPVFENNPPFWPYTLDYAINNECMITPCPNKAFPGIWEIGMVMWVDLRGGRCSMGDACSNPNDEDGVYKMLIKNFNRHYKGNRAPFGLYYHSAWFSTQHHRKGFMRFLDEINGKNDVWFITNWQLIQWLRNPTPLSKIDGFEPWQCRPDPSKPPQCRNPTVCNVWSSYGVRYMKTCQPCPTKYPWVSKAS